MRASFATQSAKQGEPNEDFAGVSSAGAVLLDGAGLSGTETRCRHGVAWYSRKLGSELLGRLADETQNLRALLGQAIHATADAHRYTCDLDDPGTPSATVVAVRCTPDEVQYLVLADSVLVVNRPHAGPLIVTDDREATIGKRYRLAMDALENGTPEHDDARREYVQALRDHRNQAEGFWVAAADPAAADEALSGALPLAEVTAIALLSDGASRLVDRFHLDSWDGLMTGLAKEGPEQLLQRVRTAERSDQSGNRWPRGKTYDDATALYLPLR